jgi:GNAT superfamily N-acetyltransferase
MPVIFRPFEPERDFALMAELHCRSMPDFPRTEQDFRDEEDHWPPGFICERFVGEVNGRPVCTYFYEDQFWAHAEGRKNINHYEEPEQETELLRVILEHCLERAEADGTNDLNIWTRDDKPGQTEPIEELRFKLVETQPVSRLDIDRFEKEGLQDSVAGFRFASIAELEAEGWDWKKKLYDTVNEIVLDIPAKQQPTVTTFEEYCRWLENEEFYDRSLMFVAVEGDRFVGYSSVRGSRAYPIMAETGLSGTVRTHRRRGIVTALKVYAIERLRDRGFKLIQTDNLDHNPMFAINQRLGFKTVWSWVHYQKRL